MKTTRLRLFLIVPFLSVLASCKKDEPKVIVETESGKIVAVDAGKVIWPGVEETVKSQIGALNREDIAGYMSYIHPDSPDSSATRDKLASTFS